MTGVDDRAAGALYGLAVGDALGMPTQSFSRATIVARFGSLLDGFHGGPPDQPIAPGLAVGTVTDDTEQALLLARLLLDGDGVIDAQEWARRLLRWEDDMRARGSLDLLGPSTRRALAELLDGGDPAQTGRFGDTNGAAMRIAPVGIATPPYDLDVLVDAVVAASAVTHNTGIALAGASAVATAVSAAVDGAALPDVIERALAAAELAQTRGHWTAGAHVVDRIVAALDAVDGLAPTDALDVIDAQVGTGLRANESVPAAFAVLRVADGDVWLTCRLGASVGGDCDTIAAMAGAVAGALTGASALPPSALTALRGAEGIDDLAAGLLALRARR